MKIGFCRPKIDFAAVLVGVLVAYLLCVVYFLVDGCVDDSPSIVTETQLIDGHKYKVFRYYGKPFAVEHELDCEKCIKEFESN